MGRIRSFLRRMVRPVAMVGTVGILSLSMIGAQPAYAADTMLKHRDAKAFEAIIKANYKTIQPVANVALAAASFTPVGLGIRLAQLGFLAYSTSDIWMPFVAGAFGEAPKDQPSGTPAPDTYQSHAIPELTLGPIALRNSSLFVSPLWACPAGAACTASFTIAFKMQCKNPTTGALREIAGTRYATQVTTPMPEVQFSCYYEQGGIPYPDVPVSGQFGLAGADGFPQRLAGEPAGGPSNRTSYGDTQPGFDPYGADVKYKVRSECIAPDGTISVVESESSGDYMKMPSCDAAGKGHGTGKTSIVGLAPGTTVEQPLWDSPRAPSDPATPLCDAMRPGSGCTLAVELDGKECQSGNVECENWQEVNQNDPNKNTDKSRLKCRLGPYTVPLSQCGSLAKAFLPGGTTWAGIEPDGSPSPGGVPSRAPSGNPIAAPAPTTTPTTTAPGSAGTPATGSPGADEKSRSCFPTGWAALNPVEWVVKPLRCVFEPSSNPQDMVTRLGIRSATKAPISFLNMEMVGPSGSGCPNWVINVPGFSQNVVCGSSFTAAILSVRGPLFALVATAMIWPLLRSLWYAAIPILRVTPTGGK